MKAIKQIILAITITFSIVSCDSKKDKEYYLELTDGTSVLYNSGNDKEIFVRNWNEFNTTNRALQNLKEKEYKSAMNRLENLNNPITNLGHTVPTSLKTEEVVEDITDLQQEYTQLINEKNKPLKKVEQNVEELIDKFDDLREDLNEVVEDYVS